MWNPDWLFGEKIGVLDIEIPGEPRPLHRPLAGVTWVGRKPRGTIRDNPENRVSREFVRRVVEEFIMEGRTQPPNPTHLPFPLPKKLFYFRVVILNGYDSDPKDAKSTKPDIDNLEKLVYDALNGLIWEDDGQVTSALVEKGPMPEAKQKLIIEVWLSEKGRRWSKPHIQNPVHKKKPKAKQAAILGLY